jgi:CheY-like chemotaxis protein
MRRLDPHTPRVLVVDESEASRTQVTNALRAAGLHALALGSAQAAIPVWTTFRPDVAIVAAHAPRFSSVEVARRLQIRGVC